MKQTKYILAVSTAFALLLFFSCKKNFEAGTSKFSTIEPATQTITYTGKKAGDFKQAAQNIDWNPVQKLVVQGYINQQDIYIIRNYAMRGNSGIKELDFKDADILEGTFPDQAFSQNRQLERFVYPRKMITSGNNVLNDCFYLKEIILPQEVGILGEGALEAAGEPGYLNGKAIERIPMAKEKYNIPPMVKELANGCYMYYPYATLQIPDGIESFGIGCFGKTRLESFVFPKKITVVRNGLLGGSRQLKNVVMHNSITEIQDYAFQNCESLEELVMPESITAVGKQFISGTKSLKKIQWSPKITALPEEALYGIMMEEFRLPETVKSLGRHCFFNTYSKRVYLPQSITELGEGLFNYNLNGGRSSLQELHVKWPTPLSAGKAFNISVDFKMETFIYPAPDYSKLTLYVPKGTKAAYQNAEGWKKFGTIIEE